MYHYFLGVVARIPHVVRSNTFTTTTGYRNTRSGCPDVAYILKIKCIKSKFTPARIISI